MKITIPPKFISILEKNDKVYGGILKLTSEFSGWFSDNKTEFFPEYTDHGIDHIESVLKTAEELITNESFQLLSPQDIYVLITSVLLHDCAMHINRDGLWDLLSRDVYNGVSLGLDGEKEWRYKWDEFCSDVKRFTESDWNDFFGEYREFDMPEIGCSSLSDNQKVIVGDFVRRHHATIAQVIVNNGIPSKSGPQNIFDLEFHYLNQLSGFVARSHNYSLREAMDILGDDRKRKHRETHPTYLMGVLRVADYMQFTSARTPKVLFNIKGFCSPISIKEWKKHLAIISTHQSHPDDALLFVEAFPEDAITLTGVRKLLINFQRELDEFWACSGEVYSRFPNLKNFSIVYRRVRSNIDNAKEYVQKNHKSYHPEILSIDTDNQKLFPLLIKPLYGDLPSVGLRELMQNAIDACNERYALETGRKVNADFIPYSVKITIDYDESTVTISDEGVGMNADIIKNYFLKIGASYRTSESWKANYTGSEGIYIPRTGKFGVGMLAGFLIGDEIEVHTVHVSNESKPIKFNYRIDSKEIELLYTSKEFVGTSIKIYSSSEKLRLLEELLESTSHTRYRYSRRYSNEDEGWWYYLDSPVVSFKTIENKIERDVFSGYAIKKADMFNKWKDVPETSLESYFWQRNYNHSNLYCNGVVIKKASIPSVGINFGVDNVFINDLEISVFDNKGIFPINLTRDDVMGGNFYEIEKLEKSVKNTVINGILNFFACYEFSSDYILSFIKYYNGDSSFLPIIFSRQRPTPFAGHSIEENFVFVDFLLSTQKRGVIYSENFLKLVEGMAYSCFIYGEKRAGTVERAIGSIILNHSYGTYYRHWQIPFSSSNQSNDESISSEFIEEFNDDLHEEAYEVDEDNDDEKDNELALDGWVFVKKFDYQRSEFFHANMRSFHDLSVINISSDWVVITKSRNEAKVPEKGYRIITELDPKVFIFALFSFEPQQTEFSLLWDQNLLSS